MVKREEAKRANGDGSAVQLNDGQGRPTGKWKIRVSLVNPATGNTERFSRTVRLGVPTERTRRKIDRAVDAEIASLRSEKERESELRAFGGDGTLRTLVEDWLQHVAQSGREASTVAMYRQRLTNHVLPRLGHLPVNQLGARQLDALYGELLSEGLAPTTVEALHTTVMGMLRQAKRWKLLNELPEPTPPRGRAVEKEPPTPAEVQRMIERADQTTSPHIAMLIRLAALTGLRRGELCGLRVEDLDWGVGTLTIRRQLRLDGEALPKGGKPRVVALGPVLIGQLQDYLARDREQLGREPGPWLLSKDGGETPLYPSRVSDAIKRLGEECGVKVHTHLLRHFHDTYLMAGGIDDVTIAKRSGHSTDIARRVYMHRVSSADVRAAETLESMLGVLAVNNAPA